MTTKAKPTPLVVDVNDKLLYKTAGIFAFTAALVLVIEIGLGVDLGKLPGSSGADWLSFVNAKSGAWSAIIAVTVVSDLLFFLVSLSLYTALRPVNRMLAMIAAVLACLGSVLDEVIANADFGALQNLGNQYAAAGTAAQRAADVAAADYPAAMLGSWLEVIFAFVIPGLAYVLFGLVMLRSPFGKRTAYVAMAAGVFTLLTISGWDLASLLMTVLQAVWLVLVGRTLYLRYAAATPVAAAELSDDPLSV